MYAPLDPMDPDIINWSTPGIELRNLKRIVQKSPIVTKIVGINDIFSAPYADYPIYINFLKD